jgi:thioredoxin
VESGGAAAGGERPTGIPTISGESEFRSHALDSPVPVLVTFSAEWCAPCGWLQPYLEELQREAGGRIRTVKVDVDSDPDLAQRYSIMSVPTVVHLREGREVGRSLGIEPDRLRAMVSGSEGTPWPDGR